MSIGRLLKFALFGHAAANVVAYELGGHKPLGYTGKELSSTQVKDNMKHAAIAELLSVGALLLVKKQEAAFLLVAYSLPYYCYQYGRYRANVAGEEAKPHTAMRR